MPLLPAVVVAAAAVVAGAGAAVVVAGAGAGVAVAGFSATLIAPLTAVKVTFCSARLVAPPRSAIVSSIG